VAKLTVQFSDQADNVLNKISKRRGLTKSDILRRAIALYDYVDEETASDPKKRLSITKEGQTVSDIVTT
jgi:predicted transcriptional regulator